MCRKPRQEISIGLMSWTFPRPHGRPSPRSWTAHRPAECRQWKDGLAWCPGCSFFRSSGPRYMFFLFLVRRPCSTIFAQLFLVLLTFSLRVCLYSCTVAFFVVCLTKRFLYYWLFLNWSIPSVYKRYIILIFREVNRFKLWLKLHKKH
jgi:hypothetical protein